MVLSPAGAIESGVVQLQGVVITGNGESLGQLSDSNALPPPPPPTPPTPAFHISLCVLGTLKYLPLLQCRVISTIDW